MSGYVADGKKDYDAAGVPPAKSHKIRITLTSKKVRELEKGTFLQTSPSRPSADSAVKKHLVSNDLVNRAKDKGLRVKGPVRLPTQVLRITTRKTVSIWCFARTMRSKLIGSVKKKQPCGEGSKTWDRYELKVHKRLIDLTSPAEIVKQITSMSIETGVEVEVTIAAP
jgi:small subunit ribosomal protein S20e